MHQTNHLDTVLEKSLHSVMGDLGHEQVVFYSDVPTGLKAIIAIHSTVLGPGMGGTRFWNYASDEKAVTDALRLSRGMTYKNAIAGLNAGGGKAVIIGSPGIKSEALLRRFGRFIDSLGGQYITAEDVGMCAQDMEYIGMETSYVTGLSEIKGGGGDPSPVTAYGVYLGIKAAAKNTYGSDDISGKRIFVQGVGHVGSQLVKLLIKEHAEVLISDIDEHRVSEVANTYKVEVVAPSNWIDLSMDIYAPCALGATLNNESIPRLKCQIIAGGANNQLEVEDIHAQMLEDRGIVYAPDFLINSGGIINVYQEYMGNYRREQAYKKTEEIYGICLDLLEKAKCTGITTHQAALQMAKDRISAMEQDKLSFKA